MTPGSSSGMRPRFFRSPAALREWLERHHASETELWVGLHKKSSGKPSVTWPELVDQLLCFGWIDGVRRSVDESSYAIRVTPRKEKSPWSRVNTARARELIELGLMQPSGVAAFERRDAEADAAHSAQRERAELGHTYEEEFRSHPAAWKFFESQPPYYRKAAITWVVSAKREETRRRRLGVLIDDSANGLRIAPMRRE